MDFLVRLDRVAATLGFGQQAPPRRHMRGAAATAIGFLILNWVIDLAMRGSSAADLTSATLLLVAFAISSWVFFRGPLGPIEAEPTSPFVSAARWRAVAHSYSIILVLLMLWVLDISIRGMPLNLFIAGHMMFSVLVLQGALPAMLFSRDIDPAG